MAVDPDVDIVMKTLDENRDKLPEGAYLKMCNALKRIHDKMYRRTRFTIHRNKIVIFYASCFLYVKLLKSLKILENETKYMFKSALTISGHYYPTAA